MFHKLFDSTTKLFSNALFSSGVALLVDIFSTITSPNATAIADGWAFVSGVADWGVTLTETYALTKEVRLIFDTTYVTGTPIFDLCYDGAGFVAVNHNVVIGVNDITIFTRATTNTIYVRMAAADGSTFDMLNVQVLVV